MELKFDYKEGCYLFNGTMFPEVVIHKTIYKLVTIAFQEWGDYKPFKFKVYDLTNKLDVDTLNERYKKTVAEQDPDIQYGIKLGTLVEYDYLNLIFLRMIDKKILSFVLKRPLLFDYLKARDKYIVADSLNKIDSLQADFDTTWEQFFRIPLDSYENINWDIKSEPIPLNLNVNEDYLSDKFGNTYTDSITLYDFLNVIDTDTFSKIPNEEIKNELTQLIRKTLEIAKENGVIGKEDPNKKPQEPKVKFFVELSYKKDGEQTEDIVDVLETSEYNALELAKKQFLEEHKGDSRYELLFTSIVEEPKQVVPITDVEPKEIEKVIEPKKVTKKSNEQILKEIDEVDPEDLLSLLNEI